MFAILFGSDTEINSSKGFWFIKKRREIRLYDPLATLHGGEGAKSWPGEWTPGDIN